MKYMHRCKLKRTGIYDFVLLSQAQLRSNLAWLFNLKFKKVLQRAIVVILILSFFSSTCCYGLAPELRATIDEFKEQYLVRSTLIAHDAVNAYIKLKINPSSLPKIDITALPQCRSDRIISISKGLEFNQDILIVGIDGLLKNTGQLAHVGLGRKNSQPVIYIDSRYFYDEDVLRHEKDEIAQWETERRRRHLTHIEMRDWIKKYIDIPEPLTGLTTRRIAENIHASSHNIEHIYSDLKKKSLDYLEFKNIYSLYLAYGLNDVGDDINIAARKNVSGRRVSRIARLRDNLERLSKDPSTGLTAKIVSEILRKVSSREIKLAGEDLDIVKVETSGSETVIGPVDAVIAHRYKLLHRAANTFIITQDGKLIIQRRVHNKVKPLALTIPGGHVSSGNDYEQTVRYELVEEIGLPKGWEPKGQFHLIGRLGGFFNNSESPPNMENISNYFYFASVEETEMIRKDMAELNAMKHRMTRKAFERWLEEEQKRHSLRGETWSMHEFYLENLIDIALGNNRIQISETFSDGTFNSISELTDDLLQKLLCDPDVVKVLRNAVQVLKIDHKTIEDNLKKARQAIVTYKYDEANGAIDAALKDIELILSVGCSRTSPILTYYYNAKVMKKVLKGFSVPDKTPAIKNSVQVLLTDVNRQLIVLQVRGPYKRLFAGKRTVSANAKPENAADEIAAVIKAVMEEVGLSIDPSRLVKPEGSLVRIGRLTSLDFIAFSSDEEKVLQNAYELIKNVKSDFGVIVEWDPQKRSLCVFSRDNSCDQEKLCSVADRIKTSTGIYPIYPVFNEDHTSAYIYTLTPDEERTVRKVANARARTKEASADAIINGSSATILKAVDSDDIIYESWTSVKKRFTDAPRDFALDLIGPAFSDEAFWEAAFPSILMIDSPEAAIVSVSGGKGANTHLMRTFISEGKINGLEVPDASIVTTYAYQRFILGNSAIRDDIELLDKTRDIGELKRIAEHIQEKILMLELPEGFKKSIEREFYRLGGNIAVRSSATVEDLKKFSGAGLAKSYIPITTSADTLEAVKKVWASLFDEGFVNARRDIKFSQADAFMGVMLQKVTTPRSSGVVFTINSDERPIFVIQAKPGYGEGVVQGEGKSDRWLVGFLADAILERAIVDPRNPCMTDEEVLKVARLVKLLHRQYKALDCADNVDIEFVVNKDGDVSVVQTRAKQSFATKASEKSVFLISVVDEKRVPPGTNTIDLEHKSVVATYGAVTAKIQVLKSTSGNLSEAAIKHLAARAKPGVILVTHHTNNEFNGVFSKLAGVITTDGNMTSHAAQNSAPLKIPCLVGAADAFEKLEQYDGKLVTFDSDKRRIYVGEMPIIEEERKLSIWLENNGEPEAPEISAVEKGESHEIFQRWATTRSARPETFRDYPEDGHLRLRSNIYRKFELDYYYKAWDKLNDFLNRHFEERSPWKLAVQDRVIKWRRPERVERKDDPALKIVRNTLTHRIVENDPYSIFYFIQGVKDLNEDDMQALFDQRWRGFQTFASFMNSIDEINSSNVEQAVDELIDAFTWMHFGFWLDVTVTHLFAHEQLRYVNPQYYQVLKEEASFDLPATETIDDKRPDVQAGKILKLSRVKDKEMGALVERIWSDRKLLELFELEDAASISNRLSALYPGTLGTIEEWSNRFKETSEHLDELSDTTAYIEDIKGRVMTGNTVRPEFIASLCLAYMEKHGQDELKLEEIRANDENLFLLIHGCARVNAAIAKAPSWKDAGAEKRIMLLKSVSDVDIEREIKTSHDHLAKLIEIERGKRDTARKVLANPDYARLKKIAALSNQEFLLREDGHHLIVPHQRKMARMMLALGEKHKDVLGDARKIFDISTDEMIALLREPDTRFVAMTFERERELQNAEKTISEEWKSDPTDAVKHYSEAADHILTILRQQTDTTTIPRVKKAYQKEAERLTDRVKWFKDTLPMIMVKELLNVRDVSRENLNADVLLICGNDMLDAFAEAVELYASGKVRKIVVSGGLGKGTISLIRSALLERIPIRISDNEVISHESHIRHLEALDRAGKLTTVLKASEADIICQIMRYMARKRVDQNGNPASIVIKEEDIIREEKTTNMLEYFTNCKPILYKLRYEFGLPDSTPLTIAYIHVPATQFRTKSYFESMFHSDISSGAFRGISYTVEQDIFKQRREFVQEEMLREMFGIVIYSLSGHMSPAYDGKRGLREIPDKYWEAAAAIADDYLHPERIRNLFRGMISRLKAKEKWFPSDIQDIVNHLPNSTNAFKSSLLRIFTVAIDSELQNTVSQDREGSPASCLETIRDNDDLLIKSRDASQGITASEVSEKRTDFGRRIIDREFEILKILGIVVKVGGYNIRNNSRYCFSTMMISPSTEIRAGPDVGYTKTLINAINDIKYRIDIIGDIRPLHRGDISEQQRATIRELVKMTILHHINLIQKPAIPENKVLWHILERDVVSISQRSSFEQEVNNSAEKSKAPERIYILKRNESVEDAIAEIVRDCPNAVFDIALSSEDHIEKVPGGIKRLVFKGGAGDVAQLEGFIAALRALHGPKEEIIPTLKRVYSILTGVACTYEISPDIIDDPVKFARNFIFDLPPVTPIPADEISKMNKRLLQLLIAA